MSSRFGRFATKLCLAILPSLVLLAAAEGVLWLAGAPQLSENKVFQQHEFMRDCRAKEDLIERRCDPENFSEASTADPGQTSVYVFGGSSAQGYPIGETTPFSSHMQTFLDRRAPGSFAVRNLGVACRDSIYVRKCSRVVGGTSRDIYVIYAGHNDFGNFMVAQPRLQIFSEEHPAPFEIESSLARSRVYSSLVRLLHGKPKGKIASFNRLPDPAWDEAREIILETYAENIRRVIERAGDLGIEVFLVTVVSNLSEYPATRDRWHAMMNRERPFPDYLQPWRTHYKQGIDHFESGKFEASLREFKLARDRSMNGRAPSALNERIRELSRAHPHVHLVDFEMTLDRLGIEQGIGCNFFGTSQWCDQFHPNSRTQMLIARDIVDTLLEVHWPRVPIRGD
jgi:lysophospholipase L1-like esterase